MITVAVTPLFPANSGLQAGYALCEETSLHTPQAWPYLSTTSAGFGYPISFIVGLAVGTWKA